MENMIGESLRPFVIKDLVVMVMERKILGFDDALSYIYSSGLYQKMLDEDSKMWYLSSVALYNLLEEEKHKEYCKDKELDNKVVMFSVFCIEVYSKSKKMTQESILTLFRVYGVLNFLEESFEVLHSQGESYIVETIDKFIKNRRRKA